LPQIGAKGGNAKALIVEDEALIAAYMKPRFKDLV
jgi:hypothetical protein